MVPRRVRGVGRGKHTWKVWGPVEVRFSARFGDERDPQMQKSNMELQGRVAEVTMLRLTDKKARFLRGLAGVGFLLFAEKGGDLQVNVAAWHASTPESDPFARRFEDTRRLFVCLTSSPARRIWELVPVGFWNATRRSAGGRKGLGSGCHGKLGSC
jgi:hypothetical protein